MDKELYIKNHKLYDNLFLKNIIKTIYHYFNNVLMMLADSGVRVSKKSIVKLRIFDIYR
jgi:hypothetical protein